ncbi:MAG: hypothetical protein ACK6CT_12545, partial [Planctomycetia bacterium]
MPSLPAAAPRPRRVAGGLVLLLAVLGAVFTARAETRDVATFLTDGMLDRQQRRVLEEPGEWTDAKQRMLIRVLATLDVPAPLMIPWKDAASDLAARGAEVADALVRVRGRATFVAE